MEMEVGERTCQRYRTPSSGTFLVVLVSGYVNLRLIPNPKLWLKLNLAAGNFCICSATRCHMATLYLVLGDWCFVYQREFEVIEDGDCAFVKYGPPGLPN
jgi:hypothetical protein